MATIDNYVYEISEKPGRELKPIGELLINFLFILCILCVFVIGGYLLMKFIIETQNAIKNEMKKDVIVESELVNEADEKGKKIIKPINGKWTEWTRWSKCIANCGEGYQFRTRSCDGVLCQGDSVEKRQCKGDPCASNVFFEKEHGKAFKENN